jgi:DNA polymerase
MKISCDHETRSPVDLKKAGAHVYFEHPETRVLMTAYRLDDGPLKIWTYDQPAPVDLQNAIASGAEINGWNVQFEALGFNLLADRAGWPRPRLEQFRDTAAAAAAMALPRALGDAAIALGLDVQKDKEGMRLIRLFSIPRKPRKDEPDGLYWNEPTDHPADWALFKSYCMRDVEVEEGVGRRVVPLSDDEQAMWVLTARINNRGIRVDRASARAAARLADKAKKVMDAEMREATSGAVTACSQVTRLVEWVASQGVDMASAGKAEILDLLELDDLPPQVRRALEIRQEAGKTSVSKLTALLTGSNSDGRIRGTGIYHAASTGREQSVRFNRNNLPRPRAIYEDAQLDRGALFRAFRSEDPELLTFLYGDALGRPLHLISDALRSFIWAAPGHDFVQADYSGIEGAVAAWVADEHWKVQALHDIIADPTLPDMYRRTAASITGTTTDVITKKHPLRQSVGKVSELSMGFAGGVLAFYSMSKNYGIKLDPLFDPVWASSDEERRAKAVRRYESVSKRGKEGTGEMSHNAWVACELIKVGWRATNPAIAKAWHIVEDGAREAIRNPGTQVVVLGGRITFLVRNGFLWMRLPSGRCLAYAAPKLKDQVWAKIKLPDATWSDPETMDREDAERGELAGRVLIQGNTSPRITILGTDASGKHMVREGLYSGLIFENLVQAIARDLLKNGMFAAEAAGYPIVFSVYDEVVTEVPFGWGDLEGFERLIAELPEWAKTGPLPMPLTASGYRSKRYHK